MREEPMKESFVPVKTRPEVPANSELVQLRDDSSGLTIVLEAPDNSKLDVCFPNRLAFLVTDEGDRLRSMGFLNGAAKTPVGRIEHSQWKQWFISEALEVRESETLEHWCVATPNDIVDVISKEPPVVSIHA